MHYGYLSIVVIQDNLKVKNIYTISAFDQVFASIGGMAGFIYAITQILIGTYQNFAFENSLLKRLYTLDKGNLKRGEYSTAESEKELEEAILSRAPFIYSYWEYWSTRTIELCCCCCVKNRPCFR